jgi:hypothetical protein
LIRWPETFNKILVDAGFDEGSFAGLHWKSKVIQGDVSLLKSRADIADLKDQDKMLIDVLSKVKSLGSPEVKAEIDKLDKLNTQLVASSAKVQESVENTISANSRLVQNTQPSTGPVVTWGIVYGGDQNLENAKYEVNTIAPKLGLANGQLSP